MKRIGFMVSEKKSFENVDDGRRIRVFIIYKTMKYRKIFIQ